MSTAQQLLQQLQHQQTDPQQLALMLLQQALQDGALEKSLASCHTDGVDSIVLQDNTDQGQGMVRFYFAHHGRHGLHQLLDEQGHFVVGIHNHRYPIAKIALNDQFVNVRTAVSGMPTGHVMYEYQFDSALRSPDGRMRARSCVARHMQPVWQDQFWPGQVALMQAEDLHTMIVPPRAGSSGTAWMVIEGAATDIAPLLYSPRPDLQLSSQGLYQPMAIGAARQLVQHVLQLTKTAAKHPSAV